MGGGGNGFRKGCCEPRFEEHEGWSHALLDVRLCQAKEGAGPKVLLSETRSHHCTLVQEREDNHAHWKCARLLSIVLWLLNEEESCTKWFRDVTEGQTMYAGLCGPFRVLCTLFWARQRAITGRGHRSDVIWLISERIVQAAVLKMNCEKARVEAVRPSVRRWSLRLP